MPVPLSEAGFSTAPEPAQIGSRRSVCRCSRFLDRGLFLFPFFNLAIAPGVPVRRAKGRLKNHFGVLAIAAHQALNTEDVPLYSPASRRFARARWVGNSINRKRTPTGVPHVMCNPVRVGN